MADEVKDKHVAAEGGAGGSKEDGQSDVAVVRSRPRLPHFTCLRDFLSYSYASFMMSCAILGRGGADEPEKKDYMLRMKWYKRLRTGGSPASMVKNGMWKLNDPGHCWYCGSAIAPRGRDGKSRAEADHVLPKAHGGPDVMDNILPACRSCNSRKGARDPFRWYAEERGCYPPWGVMSITLKLIWQYAEEHGLMGLHAAEIAAMDIPFSVRHLPLRYPTK